MLIGSKSCIAVLLLTSVAADMHITNAATRRAYLAAADPLRLS